MTSSVSSPNLLQQTRTMSTQIMTRLLLLLLRSEQHKSRRASLTSSKASKDLRFVGTSLLGAAANSEVNQAAMAVSILILTD